MEAQQYKKNAVEIIALADGMTEVQWSRIQHLINNCLSEKKAKVTFLVPKSNTQAKAVIDQAIAVAIEAGVSTKWNNVRPPQPAICIHDGDGVRPSDGQPFGEECKGCWVFTASAKADHGKPDVRRPHAELDRIQINLTVKEWSVS